MKSLFLIIFSFVNLSMFAKSLDQIQSLNFLTSKRDSASSNKVFMIQYRNRIFDFPGFYFNGRTSYLNVSTEYRKFEFGVGINPFGIATYKKLNSDFQPTDEWISKSNIWLLYIDFPLAYDLGKWLKLKKSKLIIGTTPQFLIAGKSQFVSQAESPIIIHDYDLYKDPNYIAFETKFNIRFMLEYRISFFNHFEFGINVMQNLNKISPGYFQVNHSYFPLSKPIVVRRIGGIGITVCYNFKN